MVAPPPPARRRSQWKWVLLVLLVLGATVWLIGQPSGTGAAQGDAFAGPATRAASGPTLRLGTFNIDGGQGTDGKLDLPRTASCFQRVDFIGLNEVHGYAGDPPNQAVPLGGLWGLPYLYVPAERRWGHDSFGNAAFTDLPVQHWERVVLPSAPFHAKRNYLLTTVKWGGRTLSVLTTHVDFKSGGDEQLRLVIDQFLKLPAPAVLMGDLNHTADSSQITQLAATPGVHEAVNDVYGTQPGRVDWIFHRGLTTVDAGIVDLQASDHPAYWAQVRANDGPTTRSGR